MTPTKPRLQEVLIRRIDTAILSFHYSEIHLLRQLAYLEAKLLRRPKPPYVYKEGEFHCTSKGCRFTSLNESFVKIHLRQEHKSDTT